MTRHDDPASSPWPSRWRCVLRAARSAARRTRETDIAKTVHNLTPEGPGKQKETVKTGLCVFCHTPHNGNPGRALWNKDLPGITYQLYTSTTTRADLKQPTGSSRLCLSCHDGFVAMGNLLVPPPGDALKLGALTGPTVLGTDLSDDHPISFVYDSALAAKHPGLSIPAACRGRFRSTAPRKCSARRATTRTRATAGKFLRMDNPAGAMCVVCHDPIGWKLSSHAISPATWKGGGINPFPADGAPTVAGNGCRNCHRTHSAAHPERLLARAQEPDNCNVCHDGSVAQKNIAAEFSNGAKYSRHPIEVAQWTHDPVENAAGMARHVACEDCHNAHAATSRTALPPLVPGTMTGVRGVASGGVPVQEATFEFQVCSKCHGFREPATAGITRVEATRIVSTKIDPSNQSFHPITAPGRNSTIAGLVPGCSATSIIGCTDCHNNNDGRRRPASRRAGRTRRAIRRSCSAAARRRHRPRVDGELRPLLQVPRPGTLLRPLLGAFSHNLHVVQQQAPCAACHDAHGSRQNIHLINL